MSAKIVALIYCDNVRAGEGTKANPVRMIQQLFTPEGQLVAQFDPCSKEGCFVMDFAALTSAPQWA